MAFTAETAFRRKLTVRSSEDETSELYSIDKQDLSRMQMEFRENFKEFCRGGVEELEKTLAMKMYAMQWCDQQH